MRARLDAIEAELQRRLVAELRAVTHGKNTLFFTTSEFNPFNLPNHKLPSNAQELSVLALEAIELRDLIGEPDEQSVGNLFRRALQYAADTSNHQRLGPIRQAEQLLDTLTRRTRS